MPYLGNIPATQFAELKYQDFTGGSGTSFTLNDPVGSAQELEVFVNNVRQEPGVAYTVSGTTLTMTGSIVASDDFYVVFQGKSTGTATHPAGQALTATDGTFSGDISGQGLSVSSADVNGASILGAPGTFYVGDDGGSVGAFLNQTASLPLRLMTSGSERLRVLAGGGLTFNGDTATANALDDYEEGTYSPTVSGSTVAGTGTFSSLSGAYTKIGNRVFVSVLIAHSNTHTLTGAYQLSLPFTSTSNGGGGFISYKTGWVTNGPDMADIATGQALCYLRYDTNTAVGDIPGSYTQNGSTARVHIFYDAA